MMVLMSLTALVHRAAMGGNQEFAVFNLSRTALVAFTRQLETAVGDAAVTFAQLDGFYLLK